jgi:DNA-binding CsgD family transcriptional regulator
MPEKADLEAEVVDAIYRGACDRSEFSHALERLRRLVDGAAAVLGETEFGRPGVFELIATGALDENLILSRYPPFARFDPMPAATMMAPAGSVVTSAQLVSAEEWDRNPFINEFLRPAGVAEAMACRQSLGGGRSGTISILQGIGRRSFDEEDLALLKRMSPHLGRAQQIRRIFNQSQERGAFLGSIVHRSSTGIIALQADGPALFVNRAAQSMAKTGDGLALDRNGSLIAADRNAAKRFLALRADVLSGGAGGIVRIARPSGRPLYVVLVTRLPTENELVPGMRKGVLVAIHDPAGSAASLSQRVAELLDLPRAAARLICALLDGEDLKRYGERTGISINTVRFHLKTAFARTGARSQAELVRQALLALNDLGPHFADSDAEGTRRPFA